MVAPTLTGVRIDLHLHSTASDGTDPPAGLIAAAAAAGLDVVALTDHDCTAGWEPALAAAGPLGIVVLPGAEISCRVGTISVHLLAYGHDPQDAQLRAELSATRSDRVGRARRMVERIAVDYLLTWEDVLEQVSPGATVGRPHIADAMIARGLVGTRDEAFETTLHRSSPYFEPHDAPQAADAVRLVLGAGGVPVMAHPRAGRRGRTVTDEDLAGLAAAGLVGVEADHPDHTDDERAAVRRLAADLGLLVTGSSDYHGAARPNALGAFTTDPEVYEAIRAAVRGVPIVGRAGTSVVGPGHPAGDGPDLTAARGAGR